MVEVSREPYPFADMHDLLADACEHFGADRLLWGSNYPVVLDSCSYEEAFRFVAEATFLDDAQRAAVLQRRLRGDAGRRAAGGGMTVTGSPPAVTAPVTHAEARIVSIEIEPKIVTSHYTILTIEMIVLRLRDADGAEGLSTLLVLRRAAGAGAPRRARLPDAVRLPQHARHDPRDGGRAAP